MKACSNDYTYTTQRTSCLEAQNVLSVMRWQHAQVADGTRKFHRVSTLEAKTCALALYTGAAQNTGSSV